MTKLKWTKERERVYRAAMEWSKWMTIRMIHYDTASLWEEDQRMLNACAAAKRKEKK